MNSLFAPVFVTIVALSSAVGSEAEAIDFSRDVRPILSGKCFACHGPDAQGRKGDLRLDERKDAIDLHALVPGSPEESLLIERITTTDPSDRMPPKGPPLTPSQVETLRSWIEEGATYERHWAYERPEQPERPTSPHPHWLQANPIDQFIHQRLKERGLQPSPPAEPAALVRRLSLDLIGLPPTLGEVRAFEENPTEEAYEATIDRLLDSPHFGEKWALPWLDLARYADSNGYQHDDLRTMWPYRNWVIQALNDDLPFDQFTIEQLAGDLLPNPTRQQLIATGFHRNVATNFSGGTKIDEVRADILHDRVSTTGQVWLGMTMECCQCHDHKFDPVSQVDYYEFYAYFNQAVPELDVEGPGMFKKRFIGAELPVVASPEDRARVQEINDQLSLEKNALENAKPAALADQTRWEKAFLASDRGQTIPWERFPWNLRGGARFLHTPEEDRDGHQKRSIEALLFYDHRFTGPYEKAIDRLKKARDEAAPKTMIMQDATRSIPTHLFLRGDYTSLGELVQPGVPDVLHPLDSSLPPNRLGLARWLVDPDNPLTARVTVNRFWAELFGQGIVTTPEDFGMQSPPPTHPALLDWLALEFIQQGWSMKQIIKTIVLSSTYRQTTAVSAEKIA
ncbi:MAG: PSD1 and planctomycete cytochrome C domain-containing protein, partial [Verrucomicrobiota bacterium]